MAAEANSNVVWRWLCTDGSMLIWTSPFVSDAYVAINIYRWILTDFSGFRWTLVTDVNADICLCFFLNFWELMPIGTLPSATNAFGPNLFALALHYIVNIWAQNKPCLQKIKHKHSHTMFMLAFLHTSKNFESI